MKKIVLTFGTISGVIFSVMMFTTMPFMDQIGFDKGHLIGYTTMVVAFLLVFFGIRSYRENVLDGYISFGRAFKVGFLIMLVSCAFYVLSWEIVYFNFIPDFVDKYQAYVVETARANGATAEEIAKQTQDMEKFKGWYSNIFFNVIITFLIEPFPVGLIMTLISALILKKRRPDEAAVRNDAMKNLVNPANPV